MLNTVVLLIVEILMHALGTFDEQNVPESSI